MPFDFYTNLLDNFLRCNIFVSRMKYIRNIKKTLCTCVRVCEREKEKKEPEDKGIYCNRCMKSVITVLTRYNTFLGT